MERRTDKYQAVKIYDRENIAALHWDAYKDGAYAKQFLLPLITGNPQTYIKNADCEVAVLAFGEYLLPLVLGNTGARANSYVCSPYAQYIRYAKKEMDIEFPKKPLFRITAKLILSIAGVFCKACRFDRVVYVNNWLLSTNLYHEFDPAQLEQLRDLLIAHYPGRAIVFRSVNERLNAALLQKLKNIGFHDLLSRQVYIVDYRNKTYTKRTDFKNDEKLFQQLNEFEWTTAETITDAELPVLKSLYDTLYISKYSDINPQFTLAFVRHAQRTGILQFQVFRHNSKIVAVIGFFVRDGVMTNPFVGYDFSYPAETGLFRMLVFRAIKEAERMQVVFNMSSGASRFKQTRGAEAAIEYNLVYTAHLKWIQQRPWRFFKWLSHRVVIPVMKKNKL
jgi:hypothetical protein